MKDVSNKYKMQIHLEQAKVAREMTDEEWIDEWSKNKSEEPYITRTQWIAYLESCVMKEAEKFLSEAS